MASSLIPDPLELLRRALARLEDRTNAVAGRGLQADPVAKALHQLLSLALTSRRMRETAMDGVLRALNLPTHSELTELRARLQRIEDKLDRLLPNDAPDAAPPRPARTRRAPAAVATEPGERARKPRLAAKAPARKGR